MAARYARQVEQRVGYLGNRTVKWTVLIIVTLVGWYLRWRRPGCPGIRPSAPAPQRTPSPFRLASARLCFVASSAAPRTPAVLRPRRPGRCWKFHQNYY